MKRLHEAVDAGSQKVLRKGRRKTTLPDHAEALFCRGVPVETVQFGREYGGSSAVAEICFQRLFRQVVCRKECCCKAVQVGRFL